MEIPINRDLRKFKTRDIGKFTFKEAGCIAVALLLAYGAYAIQRWLLGIQDVSLEICTVFALPPLAFGFLKIKGMTLTQWVQTVFKEKYLSPQILNWEKEGAEEKE